jgi:hypothetical protein
MAGKLASLGIFPRKSFHLKFPTENQVPLPLMRHFVRGYLDGDGYVCSKVVGNNHYQIAVGFISTIEFCESLSDFFFKFLNLNRKRINPHHRTKGMGSLVYNSQIDFFKIRDYLYSNANVFLKRKRDKFFALNKKDFIFEWHKILKYILELDSDVFKSNDVKNMGISLKVVGYALLKISKMGIISKMGETKTGGFIYKIDKRYNYDKLIEDLTNENNENHPSKIRI